MGLTPLALAHGITIPQMQALYGGGTTATVTPSDPGQLRPGERVVPANEVAEMLRRRKEKRSA